MSDDNMRDADIANGEYPDGADQDPHRDDGADRVQDPETQSVPTDELDQND